MSSPGLRQSLVVIIRHRLSNHKTIPGISSHSENLTRSCVMYQDSRRGYQSQVPPYGSEKASNEVQIQQRLVNSLQQNAQWLSNQYDRYFGIAEVRDIQARVLEAESEFVGISKKRKSCQDKIETIKEEIKNIRDKLDITPRQSDNYLKLITEEHKLLREQLTLDAHLQQYKDSEQFSLGNLSKLLRQSHELERLRQERAKYWQIISVALSLIGSLVALIAQRVRNQKSVINQLNLFENRLLEMETNLQAMTESNERYFKASLLQLNQLQEGLERLSQRVGDRRFKEKEQPLQHQREKGQNWMSWIPGLTTIWSWSRIIY